MSDSPLMAGGIPISIPSVEGSHLNMLIWGDSGSGKTTLAATAPGKKLFIMFDPGGDLSLTDRDDVAVLNLSAESATSVVTKFRTSDPYDLDKILKSRPDIETVVVDSMTTLAYAALQFSVSASKNSSLEVPGMHGYTYRNAVVLRVAVAIMRICAMNKRHLILITHEGSEDRNEEGVVLSVTMALSNNMANQIGLRFNEVWHLADNGKDRVIAVRPCRLRKPMKTRLFDATQPEFTWHYDPNTHVGDGIADWYHVWQAGKGKKLPLPTRVTSTTRKEMKK